MVMCGGQMKCGAGRDAVLCGGYGAFASYTRTRIPMLDVLKDMRSEEQSYIEGQSV